MTLTQHTDTCSPSHTDTTHWHNTLTQHTDTTHWHLFAFTHWLLFVITLTLVRYHTLTLVRLHTLTPVRLHTLTLVRFLYAGGGGGAVALPNRAHIWHRVPRRGTVHRLAEVRVVCLMPNNVKSDSAWSCYIATSFSIKKYTGWLRCVVCLMPKSAVASLNCIYKLAVSKAREGWWTCGGAG